MHLMEEMRSQTGDSVATQMGAIAESYSQPWAGGDKRRKWGSQIPGWAPWAEAGAVACVLVLRRRWTATGGVT